MGGFLLVEDESHVIFKTLYLDAVCVDIEYLVEGILSLLTPYEASKQTKIKVESFEEMNG